MRKIAWVLLLAVLAAGSALAADDPRLETRVTYQGGCLPLGEMVPKLGAKAGVSLSASAGQKDLMAFVRVKDRSLGDVMRQIALTFDLTWSHDATDKVPRYTLEQTKAQKRRAESATRAAKLKQVQSFKACVKRYSDAMKVPEAERNRVAKEWEAAHVFGGDNRELLHKPGYVYSELQNGDVRMAIELMSGWTDDDWMNLLDSENLVLSTDPTPAQSKLPDWYLEAAKRWQAEAKAYHSQPSASRFIFYRAEPNWTLGSGRDQAYDQTRAAVMKLRFLVEGGNIEASGEVLDKDHSSLMQTSPWFSNTSLFKTAEPPVRAYSADPLFDRPYKAPERLLQVRATRDGFADVYEPWVAAHGPQDFLEPDDVLVGPWLSDVADKMGVDVVADPSGFTDWLPDKEMKLGELLQSCGYGMRFDAANGWLRAKSLPVAYDFGPVPRPVLRKAYAMLHGGHGLTIDQLAELATSLDDMHCAALESQLEQMYHGIQCDGLYGREGPGVLRFWASLLPQQRTAMLGGATVGTADLLPEQRQLLWLALRKSTGAYQGFDWTEVMPTGLPPGMTFAVAMRESKTGYVASVRTSDWLKGIPDSDARNFDIVPDAVDVWRFATGTDKPMARFYKGDMWSASFGFTFRQGVEYATAVSAQRIPGNTEVDATTDKELNKLLEDGLKQMKEKDSPEKSSPQLNGHP